MAEGQENPVHKSHYNDLDLARLDLTTIPGHYLTPTEAYHPGMVQSLALHHNQLVQLPAAISQFLNLVALDLSSNSLAELPAALCRLDRLKILLVKNNYLDALSFPKPMEQMGSLEVINLSGNKLQELPQTLTELPRLKALYAGGNQIRTLPCKIGDMTSLEVLYLGGNNLKEIPATIGRLKNLNSLVLCDNRLQTIPSTIAHLQSLESLSLHNNCLRTLPTEIVTLTNLSQLSLRSNPLVARFVREMTFDPPSLLELAGRVIRMKNIPYTPTSIPRTLFTYLNGAHECVNPKCKGVYFEAKVEHVKFSDFCGKFRVPLMQYLCTPTCSTSPAYAMTESSSEGEQEDDNFDVSQSKLKKVLLG